MSHLPRSSAGVTRILKSTLLAIPFIILIALSIVSIAVSDSNITPYDPKISTQQLNAAVSPLFYCILDHEIL
jgi:hypothetical protein